MDLVDKIRKGTTSTSINASESSNDIDFMNMTPTKSSRAGPVRRTKKPSESRKFDKIIMDSERISSEEVHGLLTQVLKDQLFNGVRYVKGGQVLAGDVQMVNVEMVES
jgi:hypothetical protein